MRPRLCLSVLMAVALAGCGVESDWQGDDDAGLQVDAGLLGDGSSQTDTSTISDAGSDAGLPDAGHDAGYDAGTDAGSDPGFDGGPDAGPSDGGGQPDIDICDELEMTAEPVRPNVLLVVDKSGSMNDPTQAGGTRAKIEDTKDALNTLLTFGADKIRFGWMQYPAGSSCEPGQVTVNCADDSYVQIQTQVLTLWPNGGTPTGESLQNANNYQELHDENRSNFVILLTDGVPTCPNGQGSEPNPTDNQLAVSALENLHSQGVDSFVIGLGEDLNTTDPDLLNQMAEAGGRPRPGAIKYYAANNLEDLEQAFLDIIDTVMGCELQLDIPPDIPDWLWVYFDGLPADRDPSHQNGWDYDSASNRITFYGPMCDLLRSGQVELVEVKVGCGPPV